MGDLDKKIISKIYLYETKKTFVQIILWSLLAIFFLILSIFFGTVIWGLLIEQESFDFLAILNQDVEVIKKFLFDNIFIFFAEIPKTLIVVFTIIIILLLFVIYGMIKNYKKNRNKIKSIISFWKKKI